jgi:plasmid stabilization system protein ParE
MRELATSCRYIIRYAIINDMVVILRIRHTSRRPKDP